MSIATIAVDLAKTVFELAAADGTGKTIERRRLSRSQFDRYFENREFVHVVMEACGSALRGSGYARVVAAAALCSRLRPT